MCLEASAFLSIAGINSVVRMRTRQNEERETAILLNVASQYSTYLLCAATATSAVKSHAFLDFPAIQERAGFHPR
jgi:hypothetical protein